MRDDSNFGVLLFLFLSVAVVVLIIQGCYESAWRAADAAKHFGG